MRLVFFDYICKPIATISTMKANNILKTLKIGGGLLTNVKQPFSLLLILSAVAACSNDDPASDTTSLDNTRAANDSTAAADVGLVLHADTAWADTLRGTFGDYEVPPTTIDANDIGEDGDASQAMSRK